MRKGKKQCVKNVHAPVKKKHVRCSQFPIMTWTSLLINIKDSVVL